MNDYERVAAVIRSLGQNYRDQPDLDTLAKQAGLSRFHFHRLFSSWAGVTPKSFLQCLTMSQTRKLLREGANVLDTSIDVGLSGPSRLHDLTVNLESASPGEIKSGGEGWIIETGYGETPFGECVVGFSPRGICYFAFSDDGETPSLDGLRDMWPNAKVLSNQQRVAELCQSVFPRDDSMERPDLRLLVKGSAFQVKVWRALLHIPEGHLLSYGAFASRIGHPGAARSVGSAIARNHVGYLIPCHRVIRETGVVGDYRWGNVRKRALIAWETAQRFGETT